MSGRPGTGSDRWDDISWDDAINEIARWLKKTRDESFIENDGQGRIVNRMETVGWIGGCTESNPTRPIGGP